MNERYCEIFEDIELVDRLIATSTNLLSLTYAHSTSQPTRMV